MEVTKILTKFWGAIVDICSDMPLSVCDECGYDNFGSINETHCKNCGNKL